MLNDPTIPAAAVRAGAEALYRLQMQQAKRIAEVVGADIPPLEAHIDSWSDDAEAVIAAAIPHLAITAERDVAELVTWLECAAGNLAIAAGTEAWEVRSQHYKETKAALLASIAATTAERDAALLERDAAYEHGRNIDRTIAALVAENNLLISRVKDLSSSRDNQRKKFSKARTAQRRLAEGIEFWKSKAMVSNESQYRDALRQCGERYDSMCDVLSVNTYIAEFVRKFLDEIDVLPICKLNRWLGFIQGTLIARGLTTIEAERDWTRPLLRPLDYPEKPEPETFAAPIEDLDLGFTASKELRKQFGTGYPVGNLDDCWHFSLGPYANEWSDKPHRMIYRLIAAIMHIETRAIAIAAERDDALRRFCEIVAAPAQLAAANAINRNRAAEVDALTAERDALAERLRAMRDAYILARAAEISFSDFESRVDAIIAQASALETGEPKT